MKNILLASVLLAASVSAHSAVYTCKDASGHTVYTQDPRGSNCHKSDLGSPSVYSALPAPAFSVSSAAATQNNAPATDSRPGDNGQAEARQRVAAAKKALEEGKKVRYGNERNYAKYLERIAKMEADVKEAEEALTKQ